MKKKIAVIGSGIAGLTIANLFKEISNFEVMVYEKEKILSLDEGYGIQLAPNTISILNKIGLSNINNQDFFKGNPRLSIMIRALKNLKAERKTIIYAAAEHFLEKNTYLIP